MIAIFAALALQAEAAPAPAAPVEKPIRLRCDGHSDLLTQSTGLHFLAKGGFSTSTYYGHREAKERVLFEMAQGQARLHLPKSLVTVVNSGGEDGWWPVDGLKVTDDAISGHVRINFVNKPSFRIDRINGDIDLAGLMPFRGQCESNVAQERKF